MNALKCFLFCGVNIFHILRSLQVNLMTVVETKYSFQDDQLTSD